MKTFKNISIVGIVLLTLLVPFASYGQSQAADPAKENSSQNQMGPAPSEEELEKAKKEGEEELKKAQQEIKKDREEMEKAIEEAKKIRVKGSHYLREDEVKRLQEQALKGSPDAAYRLWGYYEFTNKRDLEKRDFWEVIAAENGDAFSQYNYGVRLSMNKDPINKIRARFWWKKAAAKGRNWSKKFLEWAKESNKLPDEILDEIKKIEASVKKAPVASGGRETENKEQGRAGK